MVKKLLLLAAIGYTILLVIVYLINLNGVPQLGSSFDDKIYHFLAYFVLAGLWITYFKNFKNEIKLYKVFVGMILFGIVLELVQHQFNPNRTYDTLDLLANCLGVIVGTLIAARLNIIKLK
ncbi:VanZ family protein [Winogradskyella tangerina]|uniref:VanZ family protein n=1 Tax=Winogradskyella tangerina TaxID=2023240 RepID=UPI000DBE44DF|nr:VanZ family protein [Winogradskyella tangerina]